MWKGYSKRGKVGGDPGVGGNPKRFTKRCVPTPPGVPGAELVGGNGEHQAAVHSADPGTEAPRSQTGRAPKGEHGGGGNPLIGVGPDFPGHTGPTTVTLFWGRGGGGVGPQPVIAEGLSGVGDRVRRGGKTNKKCAGVVVNGNEVVSSFPF